jgi:hypothetical protein
VRNKEDFPGRRSEKEGRLSWKEERERRKTFLEGGVRKKEDFLEGGVRKKKDRTGRRSEKEGKLSWKEE